MLIKLIIIYAKKLVSILTSIFNVIIFYSKLHLLSTDFTHLGWFATLNRKTGRGRWARWPCFKTWYWHIILAWVAQTQLTLIRLGKTFSNINTQQNLHVKYISLESFSDIFFGNREIKQRIYGKWQTWICTTWQSFSFTWHLLFIITTWKSVGSHQFYL